MARRPKSDYLSSVTVEKETSIVTNPSPVTITGEGVGIVTYKESPFGGSEILGDIVAKGKPIRFACDCGRKHKLYYDDEAGKIKHDVTEPQKGKNEKGKEFTGETETEDSGTSIKDSFMGTGKFADTDENNADSEDIDKDDDEDE